MNNIDYWKQGIKSGFPVFMGYITVSFTFGIAASHTLTPVQAVIMSATNYTSAGQFAGLGLIVSSSNYLEMAVTQLIINMRYFLMSCALSQKLERDTPFLYRVIIAAGVTDEVFGISVSVPGRLNACYSLGIMSIALPGWVLGTLLGGMSKGILPVAITSALGIAIYSMFIALVIPVTKGNRILAGVVMISMAASTIFDLVPALMKIPEGVKFILLTVTIAAAAAGLFPIYDNEKNHEESAAAIKRGQV